MDVRGVRDRVAERLGEAELVLALDAFGEDVLEQEHGVVHLGAAESTIIRCRMCSGWRAVYAITR